MQIIKLTAENVKRLKAVEITPEGHVVEITGRNGQGKSSVLDSIIMALGGAASLPAQPIRRGEDHATIEIDLGEIIVRRRFTDGKTYLDVVGKDGRKYPSPQSLLDGLTSSLAFDPLAFTRCNPKEQRQRLIELLGIDVDSIDSEHRQIFDRRTIENRELDRLRAEAQSIVVPHGTPDQPVSMDEIAREIEAARKANAEIESAKQQVVHFIRMANEAQTRIERLTLEIKELRSQIESCSNEADRLKPIAARQPIPTENTGQRLAEAQAINANVAKAKQRAAVIERGKAQKAKCDELTAQLDALTAKRTATIAAAKMPIDGLEIAATGLKLNGVELSECSSAEQLRLSVAMGLAANPKLRVMLIHDGSLLDSESMKLLAELATAHDAQVWIERVTDGENIGIVIEDGSVAIV